MILSVCTNSTLRWNEPVNYMNPKIYNNITIITNFFPVFFFQTDRKYKLCFHFKLLLVVTVLATLCSCANSESKFQDKKHIRANVTRENYCGGKRRRYRTTDNNQIEIDFSHSHRPPSMPAGRPRRNFSADACIVDGVARAAIVCYAYRKWWVHCIIIAMWFFEIYDRSIFASYASVTGFDFRGGNLKTFIRN